MRWRQGQRKHLPNDIITWPVKGTRPFWGKKEERPTAECTSRTYLIQCLPELYGMVRRFKKEPESNLNLIEVVLPLLYYFSVYKYLKIREGTAINDRF